MTQPDRPRGRGQRVSDAPVKALAVARGLPVLQPARLSRELFETDFQSLDADLGVVAAYGKILPEWLLQTPRLGLINVHASLLPKYRGAAPIQRAVVNGETETGVTIMRVVKALDAGPMLARAVRPIGPDDPSDAVERDLATLGADLLVERSGPARCGRARRSAAGRCAGDLRAAAHERRRVASTSAARRWTCTIRFAAFGRGRRRTPFSTARGWSCIAPGSRAVLGAAEPGTCVAADPASITVMCGDGRAIDVLDIQPEGRRVMTARDYQAGHGGLVGQRFG